MRVLLQAGHWPNAGGAPGEAVWARNLAGLVRDRLVTAGIEVAIIGDFYNKQPPPECAQDWDLFVSIHYDAAVYALRPGGNTGAFAGRALRDPKGSESDRALWYWNRTYFKGLQERAGYDMRRSDDRSNPNVTNYYGFLATTVATPGILIEHGVGSPVPSDGYPAGLDAAILRDRIDLVADLDAQAIVGYLGLPPDRDVEWSPLEGTRDTDPTDGGFRYLERTPEGVYHPGIDLNAGPSGQSDCGAPVRARFRGTIRYVGYHASGSGRGFGWHVWGEADGLAGWAHLCHLEQHPEVVVGQRVAVDTVIGYCGNTAGWPNCHTHTEVYRDPPPHDEWSFWPSELSLEAVAALTYEPVEWLYRQAALGAIEEEELPKDTTPEERASYKGYFEQLGTSVNTETALMKRAALAYKRDESRGPAISGEYPYGTSHIRQDFTAGTLDYNVATGETNWAEINIER